MIGRQICIIYYVYYSYFCPDSRNIWVETRVLRHGSRLRVFARLIKQRIGLYYSLFMTLYLSNLQRGGGESTAARGADQPSPLSSPPRTPGSRGRGQAGVSVRTGDFFFLKRLIIALSHLRKTLCMQNGSLNMVSRHKNGTLVCKDHKWRVSLRIFAILCPSLILTLVVPSSPAEGPGQPQPGVLLCPGAAHR